MRMLKNYKCKENCHKTPMQCSKRMETPATLGYNGQLATDEESYGEKLLFA